MLQLFQQAITQFTSKNQGQEIMEKVFNFVDLKQMLFLASTSIPSHRAA